LKEEHKNLLKKRKKRSSFKNFFYTISPFRGKDYYSQGNTGRLTKKGTFIYSKALSLNIFITKKEVLN
jgi:hypothetical protein